MGYTSVGEALKMVLCDILPNYETPFTPSIVAVYPSLAPDTQSDFAGHFQIKVDQETVLFLLPLNSVIVFDIYCY